MDTLLRDTLKDWQVDLFYTADLGGEEAERGEDGGGGGVEVDLE